MPEIALLPHNTLPTLCSCCTRRFSPDAISIAIEHEWDGENEARDEGEQEPGVLAAHAVEHLRHEERDHASNDGTHQCLGSDSRCGEVGV